MSMGTRVNTASWALILALCFNVHADQALEDRVRDLASELRCVACQNLSVADSPAEMAVQMRGIVREQLRAGKTPDEIRSYFVSRYGEWVLLAPPARGFNLAVWVLPFAALLAGLYFAVRVLRRWSGRARDEPRDPPNPELLRQVRAAVAAGGFREGEPEDPSDRGQGRIYRDLRELDIDHREGKLSTGDYEVLKRRYEAQAVRILEEAGEAAPRPPEPGTEPVPRAPGSGRTWALAAGAALLLAGGVTLGLLLGQSLRPRTSTEDSITGDFLTGTGPGGIGRPGASAEPEALLRQGQEALQRKDFKTAIAAFREVLRGDPGHPAANAYMGIVLARAGHTEAALAALDRALSRMPDLPLALWGKGMILYREGRDLAGAREHLGRLERLLPPGEQREAVRGMIADMDPEAASRGTTEDTDPAAASRSIAGTVRLAPGRTAEVGERSTLFIVARSSGAETGAPLAVKRIVRPSFPVSFTLGPGDVMIPGTAFEGPMNLSARLDRDGDPLTRDPGDPAGVYRENPAAPGARNVAIRLE